MHIAAYIAYVRYTYTHSRGSIHTDIDRKHVMSTYMYMGLYNLCLHVERAGIDRYSVGT